MSDVVLSAIKGDANGTRVKLVIPRLMRDNRATLRNKQCMCT
jgi:hypothetical protein